MVGDGVGMGSWEDSRSHEMKEPVKLKGKREGQDNLWQAREEL